MPADRRALCAQLRAARAARAALAAAGESADVPAQPAKDVDVLEEIRKRLSLSASSQTELPTAAAATATEAEAAATTATASAADSSSSSSSSSSSQTDGEADVDDTCSQLRESGRQRLPTDSSGSSVEVSVYGRPKDAGGGLCNPQEPGGLVSAQFRLDRAVTPRTKVCERWKDRRQRRQIAVVFQAWSRALRSPYIIEDHQMCEQAPVGMSLDGGSCIIAEEPARPLHNNTVIIDDDDDDHYFRDDEPSEIPVREILSLRDQVEGLNVPPHNDNPEHIAYIEPILMPTERPSYNYNYNVAFNTVSRGNFHNFNNFHGVNNVNAYNNYPNNQHVACENARSMNHIQGPTQQEIAYARASEWARAPAPQPSVSGCEPIWLGLDSHRAYNVDDDIMAALVASPDSQRQLEKAARAISNGLFALGLLREQVVVYGSLALGRDLSPDIPTHSSPNEMEAYGLGWKDPGVRCFVTDLSDVDCAALTSEQCQPSQLVRRISEGALDDMEWREVHATVVPRFSVRQWTFRSGRGVHLDLTFFSDPAHFNQFRLRQRCFRNVFWQTRSRLFEANGVAGIKAFDAYVLLLKAFAAVTLRRAVTSFQAICLGLFAAQRTLRQQFGPAPTALGLLKTFLILCKDFFASESRGSLWYGTDAIDLSHGGRIVDRCSRRARAEMYLMDAEQHLTISSWEYMNVLHNVCPETVSALSQHALDRWFPAKGLRNQKKIWAKIWRDVLPVMKPSYNMQASC